MKIMHIVIILFFVSTTSVFATEEHRFNVAMQEYLDVTGSIPTMKRVLENLLKVQAQNARETSSDNNPKEVKIILDEIHSYYKDNYLSDDYLVNLYAPLFQKFFKLSELQELILFYRTPVGQKLVKLQPILQMETMDQLQVDLRNGELTLQNRIRERLKSEGLRQ